MIAAIVIFFVLALAVGLLFALGVGLLAVIPLVLLVAVAVWLVWAFLGERSPASSVRKVQKAELLGPGGPDDPDAD